MCYSRDPTQSALNLQKDRIVALSLYVQSATIMKTNSSPRDSE